MGLFKKLKKVAGKAIKLAKSVGIASLPGGTLGQLAVSKLASFGSNRHKLKLAAQNKLVTGLGKQDYSLIGKPSVDFAYTATGKQLKKNTVSVPRSIKLPKELQVRKAVRKSAPTDAALVSLYKDWKYDDQGLTWENYARTFKEK